MIVHSMHTNLRFSPLLLFKFSITFCFKIKECVVNFLKEAETYAELLIIEQNVLICSVSSQISHSMCAINQ